METFVNACKYGDIQTITECMAEGTFEEDENDYIGFLTAARHAQAETVRFFLDMDGLDGYDRLECPLVLAKAFVQACKSGSRPVVQQFLDLSDDRSICTGEVLGEGIRAASKRGHHAVTMAVLGASGERGKLLDTALGAACSADQAELVTLLLPHCASCPADFRGTEHHLLQSVLPNDSVKVFQRMAGATERNKYFLRACALPAPAIVRLMLNSSDPALEDLGAKAFEEACWHDRAKVLQELLLAARSDGSPFLRLHEAGGCSETRASVADRSLFTHAFALACANNSARAVNVLLRRHDEVPDVAFRAACGSGSMALVRRLIRQAGSCSAVDWRAFGTAVGTALRTQNTEVVRGLLSLPGRLNLGGMGGHFLDACMSRNRDLASLLLLSGRDRMPSRAEFNTFVPFGWLQPYEFWLNHPKNNPRRSRLVQWMAGRQSHRAAARVPVLCKASRQMELKKCLWDLGGIHSLTAETLRAGLALAREAGSRECVREMERATLQTPVPSEAEGK